MAPVETWGNSQVVWPQFSQEPSRRKLREWGGQPKAYSTINQCLGFLAVKRVLFSATVIKHPQTSRERTCVCFKTSSCTCTSVEGLVLELAMGPESALWKPPTSWVSANALVEPGAWHRRPALWLTVTASRPTASPIELTTTQTLLTRPAGLRGGRKSRSGHGETPAGRSVETCNWLAA
jgi:hypothetical protein